MNELNIETLAKRVEVLERLLNVSPVQTQNNDWRSAVGALGNDEFVERIFAEGRAIREAERLAATKHSKRDVD